MDRIHIIAIVVSIALVTIFFYSLMRTKESVEPTKTKMGDYFKYFKCIKCSYVPQEEGEVLLCCPKCGSEQHKMVVGRWEYRVIVHNSMYSTLDLVKFHPLVPHETTNGVSNV